MPLVGARDPEALAVLYDRHGGVAFSLAYRIVGEQAAAEDVTQEAFITIWRNGGRFDAARGSVRSWMLTIVRNRAIDALRSRATKAPKLDFDDEAVLEQRPSGEPMTDEKTERRETARELRDVLRLLPREQSSAIELAYFGGFTQSQISGLLDLPLGTVKGRLRLGLEKIRHEMTGEAA
jgi:RNA polymerase sigma-70 factor (ECF subfamily)